MLSRLCGLPVIVGLSLLPHSAGADELSAEPQQGSGSKRAARVQPSDRAAIERLIRQLGSSKFAEREEATKQLKRLVEPAKALLREAARKDPDPEVRRRAAELVEVRRPDRLQELLKDAARYEARKHYRKAAEVLKEAVAEGRARFHPNPNVGTGDLPVLSDIYLRLARVDRRLQDYDGAGAAYHWAVYYVNYSREPRQLIEQEWLAMGHQLVEGWEKSIRSQLAKDSDRKALVSKYPLVVLHSRRYAGGGYLRSAFSFLYETADEATHRNDVQLLFDNGQRNRLFDINMVTNQRNRVADLGRADFGRDPDPRRVDKKAWHSDQVKAFEGHVYLEHVRDTNGNDFFVVFQVLAVDKDSRYVAFVWRRLPGGKTVLRP
jgi:tetratricopeptide (TPR) repeat protein